MVDGVHEKDGKIFLQLWHMGRQSHSSFHATKETVAPSAIGIPSYGDSGVRDANNVKQSYEVPRALETEEVKKTVQDYKNAGNHFFLNTTN